MTKIITCSELRHLTVEELQALLRALQDSLARTASGSPSARPSSPTWRASAVPWRLTLPRTQGRARPPKVAARRRSASLQEVTER
jgi:hypothetical protein